MKTLFLDTETTGLHPPRDKLVEVAIIDLDGNVLLNTLVNPGREIGSEAIAIHHITDDMVATAPTLKQLWPEIQDVVRGSHLIIYNSAFDTRFFPDRLGCARKVTCAMKRFARIYGQWNPKYGDHRWQKLIKAAEHVGYTWECEAHRALGDVLATRAVWKWMEKQDSGNESELRRRGTNTSADEGKYVGEYRDGNYHGQGTKTLADGDIYVGEWKDGKKHGQGTYIWADGAKYVGEWKNELRHGKGTFTHPDGRVEKGTWRNGELLE